MAIYHNVWYAIMPFCDDGCRYVIMPIYHDVFCYVIIPFPIFAVRFDRLPLFLCFNIGFLKSSNFHSLNYSLNWLAILLFGYVL